MKLLRPPLLIRIGAAIALIAGALVLSQEDAASQTALTPMAAAPAMLAQAVPVPDMNTNPLTSPDDSPHLQIRSMELRQWKYKLRAQHAKPVDPTLPPKPALRSSVASV